MRIGIDIRVADPVESGQQRYLWRLGSWLGAQGHDVHFLTVREQPGEISAPRPTALHRLGDASRARLRATVSGLSLDVLLLNPERSRRYRGIPANVLRSAYGTEQYRQKLNSFRHPLERGLRRTLRGAPWVLAEGGWERDFYEGRDPAPQVIAQSEYMRDQILESYRLPDDHVHVVHNAVDTAEFTPRRVSQIRAEMRDRWSIPENAFCLLCLGHNFRLKGLWQVLSVLAKLSDLGAVHLLVGGRGTGPGQRWKAKRLIDQYGLQHRVTMAGPIRPSLDAIAAADALLHLSWHDSFGFVALEAMACGLPVVTTSYTGASELIEDGVSGLLVNPGKDDEVIAAIRALADPVRRAQIGSAASVIGSIHDEASNFRGVQKVLSIAEQRSSGPIVA